MARPMKDDEMRREELEGDLAALGNVRVYLRLIGDRVRSISEMIGRPEMLLPALQDLYRADTLVRGVQERIKRYGNVE